MDPARLERSFFFIFLRGAFLLAVEGGLNGGDSVGKGEEDSVVQLPSDGPTCLKKVPQRSYLRLVIDLFRTYSYRIDREP